MWYLKHLTKCKSEEDYYHILWGTIYTVGRKDAQILIDDDPSISRKHCSFKVVHPPENIPFPEKPAILKVTDSSKYGTFKNSVRLEKGVEVDVNNGDILKFGQFQSEFKVCYEPFIITTSCLNDTKKEMVRKAVQTLCGHIVPEWRPYCTHLIMTNIKVTVKALCCLTSLKPIASPDYITDLLSSYKNRSVAPSIENYLPPSGELLIDKERASFCIMSSRKTVFNTKTFVFLENDQMTKLKSVIISGGGDCFLSNAANPADINLISQNGYCVIQPPNVAKLGGDDLSIYIKKVLAILRRKKKRMIPEQEIGLAVVYSSTDEYCNPDVETKGLMQQKQPSILSQSYAQEIDTYHAEEVAITSGRILVADSRTSQGVDMQSEVSFIHASASKPNSSDGRNLSGNKRLYSAENNAKAEEDFLHVFPKRAKLESDDGKTLLLTSAPEISGKKNENVVDLTELRRSQSRSISCKVQGLADVDPELCGFRSVPKKRTVSLEKCPDPALESLPRNLMKISIFQLISYKENVAEAIGNDSHIRNFKKFKKIYNRPTTTEVRNFTEHNCQKVLNVINDAKKLPSVVSNTLDDERGEFDWNSLK